MKLRLVDINLPRKAEFLHGLRKEQAVRCRVWNEDVVLQAGPEIRDIATFAHGLFCDTRGDLWSNAEPLPAFVPKPGDVVAAWYHCWDRVQLHRYDRYANGFRLVNAVSSYDLLSPPYIAPPIIRDGEIILDVAEYIAAGEYLSGGGADDPEDVQQRL